MGGKLAADFLHGLFAILVVQVAPAGAAADVAAARLCRVPSARRSGYPASACWVATCDAIAGRLGLLLGLVFGFLDEFIERLDHAFLDALHAFARSALSEAAADIVHAARNVIERIVLQAGQIVPHQIGKFLIASRQIILSLQQLGERGVGLCRLDELMVRNGAIEQECVGGDDIVRLEAVGPGDGFVVIALLHEPAGEVEAHVVANEERRFAIGEPGEFGQGLTLLALAGAKLDEARRRGRRPWPGIGRGDPACRRRRLRPRLAKVSRTSACRWSPMSGRLQVFVELGADGFGGDRLPGRLGHEVATRRKQPRRRSAEIERRRIGGGLGVGADMGLEPS